MNELWDKLAIRLAEAVEQQVTARLRSWLEKYCRSEIKVIYGETEAAAFLGVGKESLAAWRKRKIIQYAAYPMVKSDDIGDVYTYSLADLLNFREKYVVRVPGAAVYEMDRSVSLAGPEIKKLRAA